MSEAGEGGSPRGELTPQRNTNPKEQAGLPAKREATPPPASLMQEKQSWYDLPHEEMVDAIRSAMAKKRAEKAKWGYKFDPVKWMGEELSGEMAKRNVAENRDRLPIGERPYDKLLQSWHIISYPYLMDEWDRDHFEQVSRNRAKIFGQTITLDPKESMLLDAMAEAVGIPNTYRQVTNEKKIQK